MRYYEIYVADGHYHSSAPLTYYSDGALPVMSIVTVPLKARMVTGFVIAEVSKPKFSTKPVRSLLGSRPLPAHCLELAQWLCEYYAVGLGEALRQFAPSRPSIRTIDNIDEISHISSQLELEAPLTKDQENALKSIDNNPSTTILLHGHTGTGKTRIYVELAKKTLGLGRSVIMLTPEIALTTQLYTAMNQLQAPVFVLHSQLSQTGRKQTWRAILEAQHPIIVIGPRSALFAPVHNPGLIILDEAHEPAYKQDQSPRYHATRVASQLGLLTQAKVILGSATPSLTDYYLASQHHAVVIMTQRAIAGDDKAEIEVIDLKNKKDFTKNPYISNQLISAVTETLNAKKQVMIYLNRRGSARLILCNNCGWQLLCPNCDIPLVYHGDTHNVRCHICGYQTQPPSTCPECSNSDIMYTIIGTKSLTDIIGRLFPNRVIQRFDSDNSRQDRLEQIYERLHKGKIDILVGTQLLAKGLDLPKLGLVGIIAAETSLALPDFSSEERTFQLLCQVIGRVGRGHSSGKVVLQSYEPDSVVVQAALNRNWGMFYEHALKERQKFRFPPFSHLMQLVCRRATSRSVEQASIRLKAELVAQNLPVEIIGPAPTFYARRSKYYYWQIVVKSKNRHYLLQLAKLVPPDWSINLDPINLM